jgi:DNA invertase Pin-like site-specific DNA recombinase
MRLRGILLRKRFLFAQLWVKLSQGAGRLPWVSLPATLHIVSRQPKEGKDDSNSVKNQRDLLNEYYERHSDEFESEDEYVDDGHTGTDANRENFQRLLADVMSGKINCVIVKDLSRFARNYSDAGSLIENLFVQMNVRFISLAENVDSYKDPDSVSNIIVPITNVMNDNYCFQTSKKIRQVFDYKRRNGQYIGSVALQHLIQLHDYSLKFLNDAPWGAK